MSTILEPDASCLKCGNADKEKIVAASVLSDSGCFHFAGFKCAKCNVLISGDFEGYNHHDLLVIGERLCVRKKATKEI